MQTVKRGWAVGLALAIALAVGCERTTRYVGVGDLIAIDDGFQHATLHHDEIAGLMGPATTQFAVRAPEALGNVETGLRVRFELERDGDKVVIAKLAPIAAGNPGLHDHTPHHGGVVAMTGMIHLEARAEADGRLQLYLTDVWRRPLSLADAKGSVTLHLADGRRTLALASTGDALEATGPRLERADVNARFELVRDGQAVEMSFLLPVSSRDGGAAGVPAEGCAPVAAVGGGRAPRCAIALQRPATAMAITPDAQTVLLAVADLGLSAWRLPSGSFLRGFAPVPPVAMVVEEPAHAEAANAVVVRPDGREVVLALEGRLIRYDVSSGQLVKALNGPAGVVRSVAYSPDGSQLLVTSFYNAAAHLFDAETGAALRTFPVEREGAAVAFAPDGRLIAVGSEAGPIALFDPASGAQLRLLDAAAPPARALTFVGARTLAGGDDGIVRVFDSTSGALTAQGPAASPIHQLAVGPHGRLVASAGIGGVIRLHDIATGTLVDSLAWHTTQVHGLAWAGGVLVSADADGRVAFWDLDD